MAQSPSTARIRQRRRQRLILVLLLVLGIMAAAAYYLFAPKKKSNEPQVRPKGAIAVPYAKQPIPIGVKINGAMVGVRYVKPYDVPSDAVLTTSQFNGRIATRRIDVGGYFRESDLAAAGAPSSFSGLARPGHRVVVIPSKQIIDTGYLREGDMVDVLAIGTPLNAVAGASAAAAAPGTIQGGGTQPGASGRNTSAAAGRMRVNPNAIKATLVAENAKVIAAPRRGRSTENAVLEMLPQDAHVTTLSMAAGQNLRLVFRHFRDTERITPDRPLSDTTYIPRSSNSIQMITGSTRSYLTIRED